jgi:hypothetical protein
MSNRLDKEREEELQPKRIEHSMKVLEQFQPKQIGKRIEFYHKGYLVYFYPYSGWHSGKSIKDGRGLQNLLKQITPDK